MTALRNAPLSDAASTALLVVDVQYEVAAYGHGDLAAYTRETLPEEKRWYMDRVEQVMLPNIRALQDAFRAAGSEVLFTTVENLTDDGRDRSLDYKISGINVAKGSREAQVIDVVAPRGDEMRFAKSTSSVFNSTAIEYVLRNLGVTRLVIVGLLTDQCVISAVRDACDRGFLVVVPEDACATYTRDRHMWALELTKGYCRVTDTRTLVEEIAAL
nr:cysteine hydrolase [Sphingobium sp.]